MQLLYCRTHARRANVWLRLSSQSDSNLVTYNQAVTGLVVIDRPIASAILASPGIISVN